MRWERIRERWDELKNEAHDQWNELTVEDLRAIDGDRSIFVAIIRQRTGMTEEDATVSIETWAGDLSEIDLDPLSEASRHAGRDDVHEQRECDQVCEGMLHWPPHVGTLHLRPRVR
jgi:hypothetical protein